MGTVRAFIAFETPEEVRTALQFLQARLRAADADIKWEPAEKFHVTLKFLGDVDSSNLDALLQCAEKTIQAYSSFIVVYAGLGCFPDMTHPRVIWVGCKEKSGTLQKLKVSLDQELRSFGCEIEGIPFRPHVTLGRVKSERRLGYLLSILESLTFEPRVATIGEITVMKSELHPLGANHSILKSVRLSS